MWEGSHIELWWRCSKLSRTLWVLLALKTRSWSLPLLKWMCFFESCNCHDASCFLYEVELYPFSPSSFIQFVFDTFDSQCLYASVQMLWIIFFHLHVSSFIHFVWYFFFTFEILAFRIWWCAFQLFFRVCPIWDIFQEQPTMYEHEGYMVGLLLHVQFQLFKTHFQVKIPIHSKLQHTQNNPRIYKHHV